MINNFYLRRNARICAVQMAIQKFITGNMETENFLMYPDLWAWGNFNQEFFHKLCDDLEKNWEQLNLIFSNKIKKNIKYLCPILKGVINCGLLEIKIQQIDKKLIIPEYFRILKSLAGDKNIRLIYIYLN